MSREPDLLPIAVRAYARPVAKEARMERTRKPTAATRRRRRREDPARRPHSILVLDCETTVGAAQRLLVGSYRYIRLTWSEGSPTLTCVEEGLIHPDELGESDPRSFALLERYAEQHAPAVDPNARGLRPDLALRSRGDFVEHVFLPALSAQATVVGFNLPFDLPLLAVGWGEARARGFEGGFSLRTSTWEAEDGTVTENRFRPRVLVHALDSKRAHIGLGSTRPGSDPDAESRGRGAFLDLRTLAYALSGESHSLESACDELGLPYTKRTVKHGELSEALVDYCREDVEATARLYEVLAVEYERWQLKLAPTRVYSPASLAKATLRECGIKPILARQPSFPEEVLGYGLAAYFGGRTECSIRRLPVPVTLFDFSSTYPTVCVLMGLSRFLTCARVNATDEDPVRIERWLERQGLARCFEPALWRRLNALVLVQPEGDILPVRARYSAGGSFGIGVNPLWTDETVWITLADALASRLLTGRAPRILRCIRLTPSGKGSGIRPFRVRGSRLIDPMREDVFRAMVEERRRLEALGDPDSTRSARALKTVANSGAYGIFAELNRQEPRSEKTAVKVFGLEQFETRVSALEEPGAFFFPPLAALVTGAARLMLALVERSITDAGGSYAFCDTDSMAIVATREVALIPCPGGQEIDEHGRECIRALSWREADEIAARFEALNPYDRSLVPGSILRAEPENFDPETGEQRGLNCFAVSAKRYCLFRSDSASSLEIVKWSEHALGGIYLDPLDPSNEGRRRARDWTRDVWEEIVRTDVFGLPPRDATWLDRPALSQFAASHPRLLRPFAALNEGRPYREQVKPHGFLLVAHVAPGGHPAGADPRRFALVAPYERDPRKWGRLPWRNVYEPHAESYRLTSSPFRRDGLALAPACVGIKTYRDVLDGYRLRSESKSLGPDGSPCRRDTIGLLSRRPVRALSLTHIGKEANLLEEVAAGVLAGEDDVLVAYDDPRDDEWEGLLLAVISEMNVRRTAREAGVSPSCISRLKAGAKPHGRTRGRLIQVAARQAREALERGGHPAPRHDIAAIAEYWASLRRT